MSALADEPDHFLRWLRGRIAAADAATFAPRAMYGDYLAGLLDEHVLTGRIVRVAGTAVGITRADGAWAVHLHDDRTVSARTVVLALGNLPPADPLRLGDDAPEEYVRDPWAPGAAIGLAPDAPVLLIGTGLTAIDIAVALRHEGHRGRIDAISRHGHLPRAHAPSTPIALSDVDVDAAMRSPAVAARLVRRRAEAEGDWRPVIDALRPHTAAIWQRWTQGQRAIFLRHARSLWDVHRHRVVADVLAGADMHVSAGRITTLRAAADLVEVEWQPRGSDDRRQLRVARVINCTGPASDYSRVDLPLVVHMRRAGWLTPDPLRLGVETDEQGRLLGHDRQPVDGLYTLGPLRRPALWESTAVPEIRAQAAALARLLAS